MAYIWISGGKGFIGRHLAKSLQASGHRVVGIGHGAWSIESAASWGFDVWLDADVDSIGFSRLAQEVPLPEVIYHLAGGSSVGASFLDPLGDFRRTVTGSAELLDWVRTHAPDASVVTVSSAAVYGAGHAGAIQETAATSPYSPYGAHKLAMEDICRSYARNFGLKVAVVRLFSVYGRGLRKQLMWDLCGKLAASQGLPVTLGGTGGELRDWLHVEDAVRLLLRVSSYSSAACPVFNGGTGVATSIHEVASLILEAWGAPLSSLQFSGEARKGDPFCLLADCTKTTGIGFVPEVPLASGIADAVRWFKAGAIA